MASRFNSLSDQFQNAIARVAEATQLTTDTVMNVLAGPYRDAVAHGELCRVSIARAAGGQDGYQRLAQELGGHSF